MKIIFYIMSVFNCREPVKSESTGGIDHSSMAFLVITSLVIGILGAAGAALAAYFLTQKAILWTAIAGGGTFVVLITITYIALRCGLTHSEPAHRHV